VNASVAGKLRKNSIKLFRGDAVRVELSPPDYSMGRIMYRLTKRHPVVPS
jgi:translation initiation factor IF-1